MLSIPKDLAYTASHEWIREEADNTVTVGITEHAQSLLGDVVFVELPEIGKHVSAGEACAVVESVKAAADVYAPLTGEVIAVNDALASTPELINSAPFGDGWLCKIKLENKAALSELMTADAYGESIKEH